MKIQFEDSSATPGKPRVVVMEVPACPRIGESVHLDEDSGFEVRSVLWTPGDPNYDVVVRGW